LARIITESIAAGSADGDELAALATETARLLGGARTLRADLGTDIGALKPFADETDRAIDVARSLLGPEAFAAAEEEGSRLRSELNEVERLALGTLPMNDVSTEDADAIDTLSEWDELTRSEQEVATFAAAGWTNTAIATHRGTSFRTVDAQMTAIFQKLMISSRDDIIRFVPGDLIDQVRKQSDRRLHRSGARPPRPRRG
jgi:ATP/maltotriose-dependent transcriptional regulator MalT